jgi:hypothetical protein
VKIALLYLKRIYPIGGFYEKKRRAAGPTATMAKAMTLMAFPALEATTANTPNPIYSAFVALKISILAVEKFEENCLMNKLKAIVLVCILCSLTGCFLHNLPPSTNRLPFYVNNSGVDVNLTVILENETFKGEDTAYYHLESIRYKQEIKNNDILCNYSMSRYSDMSCSLNRKPWEIMDLNYSENDWVFVKSVVLYTSHPEAYKLIYSKIEFLGNPKTCLIFDGDKTDNDIRYWENYILTRDDEENRYVHYYYYITPQHKDMAKEEHCL